MKNEFENNYIFNFQNTICDKINNRFFYFENNIFLKSKNEYVYKYYIFNIYEYNILMLINEINTLSNFNIVLFYINCIMSYKID